MKDVILKVIGNRALTGDVYEMRLQGDVSEITRPGQFVNLKLDGKYLRRPISVCDLEDDVLTLVYRVVGGGTAQMAAMEPGTGILTLTGLGNGFDLADAGDAPLLVGGGLGCAPMYYTAKCLVRAGKPVTVVLGFRNAGDAYYVEAFRKLGCRVCVATEDGSLGTKGFVTTAMAELEEAGESFSYFFTCGPEPMFKALYKATQISGQFSFESRMGCGFGACMGCSCKTITGYKRICKDGPILRKEEILWQ